MKSGIYKITCIANGKIYIGSTFKISRRWADHQTDLARGKHGSKLLQAAWNEHGADAFAFEVIEFVEDLEALIGRERHYFDMLQPTGERGFNVRRPGIRGPNRSLKLSNERKEQMRQQMLGRKWSEQSREKLRQKKLEHNPIKGTKWADTYTTPPVRHKGAAHHYFGKQRDDRVKKAIADKLSSPVQQLSQDGAVIKVWPSAREAATALGLKHPDTIYRVICGKQAKTAGYRWAWVAPEKVISRFKAARDEELSGRG